MSNFEFKNACVGDCVFWFLILVGANRWNMTNQKMAFKNVASGVGNWHNNIFVLKLRGKYNLLFIGEIDQSCM